MLQTIAVVALPTLVVLAAAMYLVRRNKTTVTESSPRPRPSSGTRQNNRRDSNNSTCRRRNSGKNELLEDECVICFEVKAMVELYPCKHKTMCEDCVNKLICLEKRACPLCRQNIKGYA